MIAATGRPSCSIAGGDSFPAGAGSTRSADLRRPRNAPWFGHPVGELQVWGLRAPPRARRARRRDRPPPSWPTSELIASAGSNRDRSRPRRNANGRQAREPNRARRTASSGRQVGPNGDRRRSLNSKKVRLPTARTGGERPRLTRGAATPVSIEDRHHRAEHATAMSTCAALIAVAASELRDQQRVGGHRGQPALAGSVEHERGQLKHRRVEVGDARPGSWSSRLSNRPEGNASSRWTSRAKSVPRRAN